MQTDSIRESLTKDDIIAYIEAELSADIKHNLSIVLVEGSNDIKFGKTIFEHSVVFYESFSGKEGLTELLSAISDDRVIVVRDRDYMDINTLPSRMFVYDASCLEMMLLKNAEIVDRFCSVYCKDERSGNDILHNAMKVLAPYSLVRKKNEEQRLCIEFRAGFGDLIQEESSLMIDTLFSRTGIANDVKEQCIREADQLMIDDLYNITNGHDICKYLGCISFDDKNKNLGESRVRNILICSYRRSDFKETELYHSIKEYQEKYGLRYVG